MTTPTATVTITAQAILPHKYGYTVNMSLGQRPDDSFEEVVLTNPKAADVQIAIDELSSRFAFAHTITTRCVGRKPSGFNQLRKPLVTNRPLHSTYSKEDI